MILVPEGYDLRFTHKRTKETIYVKRIVEGVLKKFDPGTGKIEDITRHNLLKDYKSASQNKKVRSRKRSAA